MHAPGWKVAVPSNAEDAVGLLRASLRGNDPVIFFEHRAMLDATSARRPYPGDDFVLPFGKARIVARGRATSPSSPGARWSSAASEAAETPFGRSPRPSHADAVGSRRGARLGQAHAALPDRARRPDDGGFGAEIAAVVAQECFFDLDAPVARLAMPDIPSPHNPALLEWALPSVEDIARKIEELIGF